MQKKALLVAIVCLGLFGCNDDSSSGSQIEEKCNPACGEHEKCVNGTCMDGCNNTCGSDEVCKDKKCIKAICKDCGPNEDCTDTGCVDKSGICEPKCVGDQTCKNNECILDCDEPCGTVCCEEGTRCDVMLNQCLSPCPDGSAKCGMGCCSENTKCIVGVGCSDICTDSQTECLIPGHGICCEAGTVCSLEAEECTADCGDTEKCGSICCGPDEICISENCQHKCTDQQKQCGVKGELCCNNSDEVCLYNQCLPKGKPCESNLNCGIDEFCETVITNTCVKEESDPNACIVKPVAGEFKPVTKWHWPINLDGGKPSVLPDYDQVMNIPAIINLTDDNGDGKINEDDIPDLIFTAFSKGAYNNPNALRVISGKDGSEIASHPEAIFRLANYMAAAKVNDDEYPEIVLPLTENFTGIYNVVPKSDGEGYEIIEVAKLEGRSDFPKFAYLDKTSEFPQIVTSAGIIEYAKDESGAYHYQWRCKGATGDTIADLDGDGEMEIVGSAGIYNKDCQKVSGGNSTYGNIVLADLDMVDDHEDGRLDVEQISYKSGPLSSTNNSSIGSSTDPVVPKGAVVAYKIYKKEDGLFYREEMWRTDMPMDYDYVESHLKSYKYSDGTPFNCQRSASETWHYPKAGNSAQDILEYNEFIRRHNCATGGGPLVVSDFDGDGKPDIGQATTWSYVVYKGNGEILWADFNTQDASSAATGSSIFDFEGDGVAEVLYADERHLYVYKGPGSGQVDEHNYCSAVHLITPIENWSGTLREYPQVVDVDNDGQSEIILTANNYARVDSDGNPLGNWGIRAFGDPDGHWVRTRRIWNQYDYHVTNINEDGTVPKDEGQNWKLPRLNNFRQNVQPSGLFNAPNLVAGELTSQNIGSCQPVALTAKVHNKGSLAVHAGVSVKFYVSDVNGTGQTGYIGEAFVTEVLPPEIDGENKGGTATFEWDRKVIVGQETLTVTGNAKIYFVVDEPSQDNANGAYIECIENDNRSALTDVAGCPMS